MYFRKKTSAGRVYLQIVESRRTGDQVRQHVIATLGRWDELEASGQLERLLRSGARFAEKALVLGAAQEATAEVRRIGPALVFERLWTESGCRAAIDELAGRRKHGFDLERAVFLTVLHRLFGGGSDRAADRWREDYRITGVDALELHHLYRAMAWLGEALPETEQNGRTPVAPRCTKDLVEERLFAHRRDLFSRLDLVFMDTTSLSFEGTGGQTLGQHGYSKDHRPDLRQMILAVVIDGDGRPVCSEMWPGNTADVTSLVPVVDRLRRRFAIARLCVVADRGMISTETIAALEARDLLYILGSRERTDKLVRDLVLADPEPFVPLTVEKRGRPVDYEAKAVKLGGARYIVCRNHQEATKDAAERAAILKSLERQLKRGDKALVGNTGFRRFLTTVGAGHFAIDHAKAEAEAKFDGLFVLRTNTDLHPLQAMLRYKQLWTVEQTFRTQKHLFATRPIFHQLDETIRGHVFCSFLALVLKSALDDRIAALDRGAAWPDILADLDSLTETAVEQDGKRFFVRSAPRPAASLALRAAGVALPPTVRAAVEA
ncbi:MAG TPA: IS1634 family transposase [Burkholderiales bacterium]|nr:IS1634 family transposase [Burkholderiales bacterium]